MNYSEVELEALIQAEIYLFKRTRESCNGEDLSFLQRFLDVYYEAHARDWHSECMLVLKEAYKRYRSER